MRVCTRTQTCMHVRVYTCVHVVSGQSASSFARTTGAHVTARSGATARITRGHDGCGIRRMAGTSAVYLINSARYLYPLSNKTRGWCFWPVLLFADGLRADAIFGRHYSVSMLFLCRRYFWPTPLRVDATFAGATFGRCYFLPALLCADLTFHRWYFMSVLLVADGTFGCLYSAPILLVTNTTFCRHYFLPALLFDNAPFCWCYFLYGWEGVITDMLEQLICYDV